MNKEQLISEILLLPIPAIEYHLSEHLIQLFPDKALIEGDIGQFNLDGYAAANLCTLTRKTFLYNQMKTYWRAPEPEMMHPQQYRGMSRGGFTVNLMQQPLPEITVRTKMRTRQRLMPSAKSGSMCNGRNIRLRCWL